MKKRISLLFVAMTSILLVSCNNDNKTETQSTDVKKCQYSYDASTTKVAFTAYKFLNKTGVGGTFNTVNISGEATADTPTEVIKKMNFEIPVNSLDTKNAGRDEKILKFFFGTINTQTISGKVVSIDTTKGSMELSISMNGQTQNVDGTFKLEGEVFTFNADIDVTKWNGESGIKALNDECKELHTDVANGDKVSKLWPDVSISFTTTLKKNC